MQGPLIPTAKYSSSLPQIIRPLKPKPKWFPNPLPRKYFFFFLFFRRRSFFLIGIAIFINRAWGEEFTFNNVTSQQNTVRFEVWDHDRFSKDDFVSTSLPSFTSTRSRLRCKQHCSGKTPIHWDELLDSVFRNRSIYYSSDYFSYRF